MYAHSLDDQPEENWQKLEDHLDEVAGLAEKFAAPFGAGDWARVIGSLHDVGKSSEAFQRRVRGGAEKIDHSTAGAQLLDKSYPCIGRLLAYTVAGHHGGLPNGYEPGGHSSLEARLSKTIEALRPPFDAVPNGEALLRSTPAVLLSPTDNNRKSFSVYMLIKMLYSCLVDADYLDTESFCSPSISDKRARQPLDMGELSRKLDCYLSDLQAKAPKTEVNAVRAAINHECIDAASMSGGIFRLPAPTGSGKTLAALSFGLKHATKHGKSRVIYAIPYTSIVEQTAQTLRKVLGREAVLEHHSNCIFDENDEASVAQMLATENWDFPVIVTTNVQFFESLYSCKPSQERKVHNIANSVIILDEVQVLPDHLLGPCLAAIEELAENFNCSFVLATATMPDYSSFWPFKCATHLLSRTAIERADLFEHRVCYDVVRNLTLEELSDRILKNKQILCVVSSRRAASELFDGLTKCSSGEGVYHLSAYMAPVHRSNVIAEIREQLASGKTCRVVSTQLIEAGVDLDFPVVYRELAGIDSVRQAAGRCNREGKQQKGIVTVFTCVDFPLPKDKWLFAMRNLGQETIDMCKIPFSAEGVDYFFKRRFSINSIDDYEGVSGEGLVRNIATQQRIANADYSFEKYAEHFRFIDDDGISVFVPWGDRGKELMQIVEKGNLSRAIMRETQRYTISVPRYLYQNLLSEGRIIQIGNLSCLVRVGENILSYDQEKGLEIGRGVQKGFFV